MKQEDNYPPYYSIGLKNYLEMQKLEIERFKYKFNLPNSNQAVYKYIELGYAAEFRKHFVQNHCELESLCDCGELEKILEKHDTDRLLKILKLGKWKE